MHDIKRVEKAQPIKIINNVGIIKRYGAKRIPTFAVMIKELNK